MQSLVLSRCQQHHQCSQYASVRLLRRPMTQPSTSGTGSARPALSSAGRIRKLNAGQRLRPHANLKGGANPVAHSAGHVPMERRPLRTLARVRLRLQQNVRPRYKVVPDGGTFRQELARFWNEMVISIEKFVVLRVSNQSATVDRDPAPTGSSPPARCSTP